MENVLRFPESTVVGRPVPKNAFWKRAERLSALKEWLTDNVESIVLAHKLHPSTINVEAGREVEEIDVFLCRMKKAGWEEDMFLEMDSMLPRHTLFVIEHGGGTDILMHHKECVESRGEKRWRCDKPVVRHCDKLVIRHCDKLVIRHCDKLVILSEAKNLHIDNPVILSASEDPALHIEGQDMDAVYASLLGQVSGLDVASIEDYKEQSAENERREKLQRQIEALERKARGERQPRRRLEIYEKLKELKQYGKA